MPENTIILALVGHIVGDFLLQNDWMQAKRRPGMDGAVACCVHAWIWTLAVCAFAGWWQVHIVAVLWQAHFWQDRTQFVARWMRLIHQTPPERWPAGPFYVDQAWHVLTLWAAWRFLA